MRSNWRVRFCQEYAEVNGYFVTFVTSNLLVTTLLVTKGAAGRKSNQNASPAARKVTFLPRFPENSTRLRLLAPPIDRESFAQAPHVPLAPHAGPK